MPGEMKPSDPAKQERPKLGTLLENKVMHECLKTCQTKSLAEREKDWLDRGAVRDHRPDCWFHRETAPPVGSVLWICAHTENDPSLPVRWWRAVVVRVLQRRHGKRGDARIQARYESDGSVDTISWPDAENVLLTSVTGVCESCAELTATRVQGLGGRCALSGAWKVVLPCPRLLKKLTSSASRSFSKAVRFVACSSRDDESLCCGLPWSKHEMLRGYKALADVLLSGLRSGAVLHRLTWKKCSTTIICVPSCRDEIRPREDELKCSDDDDDDDEEPRCADVLGGITFRVVRSGSAVVADVLTVCVAQKPTICGRGLGTRLVNLVKRMLVAQAARDPSVTHCYIATEAETLPKAQAFWHKQQLQTGPLADHLFMHLLQADAATYFDNVTHMCISLPAHGGIRALERARLLVDPTTSKRAQEEAKKLLSAPASTVVEALGALQL